MDIQRPGTQVLGLFIWRSPIWFSPLVPALIPTYIGQMDDVQNVPKRGKGWAFAGSAVLHAVIAALLFLRLPETSPEPQKDEAVKVDIVQDKDAPKPPEEEKKPEAKAAEKPPEPSPPQDEREEAKVEQPTNPPIPMLRPVFQFGQKDEGPAKQDGSASEGEKDTTDDLTDKKPDAPQAAEPKAATEEAAKEPAKDDTPGVPDVLKAPDQQDAASTAAAGKPVEEKAATPKPNEAKQQMTVARKIYSANDLGGRAAIVAMGGMTRPERIKQLCATELGQQLIHGSPRYQAEIVPSAAPREGNVLAVPKAYFRTRNAWYEISFQCEVDPDASRVVSFAFKVGDPVPKSEWRARGFPTY